jgi:hypothetical protein
VQLACQLSSACDPYSIMWPSLITMTSCSNCPLWQEHIYVGASDFPPFLLV